MALMMELQKAFPFIPRKTLQRLHTCRIGDSLRETSSSVANTTLRWLRPCRTVTKSSEDTSRSVSSSIESIPRILVAFLSSVTSALLHNIATLSEADLSFLSGNFWKDYTF
jgi:hypothetical protein